MREAWGLGRERWAARLQEEVAVQHEVELEAEGDGELGEHVLALVEAGEEVELLDLLPQRLRDLLVPDEEEEEKGASEARPGDEVGVGAGAAVSMHRRYWSIWSRFIRSRLEAAESSERAVVKVPMTKAETTMPRMPTKKLKTDSGIVWGICTSPLIAASDHQYA